MSTRYVVPVSHTLSTVLGAPWLIQSYIGPAPNYYSFDVRRGGGVYVNLTIVVPQH